MGDSQNRPALPESLKLCRLLFDNSLDGILLADAGGSIYAANPAACRLLDRSVQEIIAASLTGISAVSGAPLLESIRDSARTGPFHSEAVFRRKDDTELPVEFFCIVATDEGGRAHASIVFREITTRRMTEKALRRSEAMLARAQQVADLGGWEWDIATGEVFWSDRQYRIFGFQPGEFQPTYERFLGMVHKEDRARVEGALAKKRAGEPYQIEFRVNLPDSTVHHIYCECEAEFDATGKPVRVMGTSLDITELRRAERELRESEQRSRRSEEQLRLLFETMQQGVVYQSADGRILSVNPAAERILGETAAELIGREPRPTVPRTIREDGAPLPVSEQPWAVAAATGREVRGRVVGVYNARREQYRWAEVSSVPLFRQGELKPHQVYSIFEDITGRKRAEELLRQSEARLRLAIESAGLGTFDYYPQTGKLVWCDTTKRQFGMSPETEIDYKMFLNAIHPEDRERIRQIAVALENPGGDGQLRAEYRAIGVEDGIERWISARGRMLFDRENRAARLIGTTLDVTPRKRLEEDLRRRAEELQKLMDVAPVLLYVSRDPECSEILGNPAAYRLIGAKEGTNLSATPGGTMLPPWRHFRDGVEIPPTELPMQIAAADGIDVRDCELEAHLPNGVRIALWGNATPLRDSDGRVRGAVGAFLDITAHRQRSEAALRESEERFQEAADTAPIVIWCADPQKRVTFINKPAVEFTGLPAEQLMGEGWTQVIHPDDLEATRSTYYEGVDNRAGFQTEYRARRANGEYRHVLATTSPRYIGGVYAGQIGTVVDITDFKRRQAEDFDRQKLESLGTLAGGIAHDFNNLLGGILSQAELASATLADGGDPEQELKHIRAVAIRGAEIVRQLMAYAGQEMDTLELIDVSRLVEESSELLQVVASKHADLRFQLGSDVPAVLANAAKMRQILINLVTNASEAIGERDGVIEISTARVTVTPDSSTIPGGLRAGEYLQLEVSDTGRGLTPEMRARIFDPFYTTKFHGRGLGLAVVRGIVRRLGGAITARGEPGQGATFQILLPGSQEPAAERRDSASAAAKGRRAGRGNVLVVEDEEPLRIAVSKMLRNEGFSVLEAISGAEALMMLQRHGDDIAVMLLDVTLPGIASTQVFHEAKRLRPDLRVVLTSAYTRQTVARMFGDFGSQPFLRKPYLLADLLPFLDA
jgi:PAS domain S-box-containing protein